MGHFDHEHDHEQIHEHTHPHEGRLFPADEPADPAKAAAVLKYMLEHNVHHAAELNDIAQALSGKAQHQLMRAVEAFDQANGYLAAALEQLK